MNGRKSEEGKTHEYLPRSSMYREILFCDILGLITELVTSLHCCSREQNQIKLFYYGIKMKEEINLEEEQELLVERGNACVQNSFSTPFVVFGETLLNNLVHGEKRRATSTNIESPIDGECSAIKEGSVVKENDGKLCKIVSVVSLNNLTHRALNQSELLSNACGKFYCSCGNIYLHKRNLLRHIHHKSNAVVFNKFKSPNELKLSENNNELINSQNRTNYKNNTRKKRNISERCVQDNFLKSPCSKSRFVRSVGKKQIVSQINSVALEVDKSRTIHKIGNRELTNMEISGEMSHYKIKKSIQTEKLQENRTEKETNNKLMKSKKTVTVEDLLKKNNIKSLEDSDMFKCFCGKVFQHMNGLVGHIYGCSTVDLLHCAVSARLNEKKRLMKLRRTRSHKCSTCGKVFSVFKHLRTHQMFHLKKKVLSRASDGGKKVASPTSFSSSSKAHKVRTVKNVTKNQNSHSSSEHHLNGKEVPRFPQEKDCRGVAATHKTDFEAKRHSHHGILCPVNSMGKTCSGSHIIGEKLNISFDKSWNSLSGLKKHLSDHLERREFYCDKCSHYFSEIWGLNIRKLNISHIIEKSKLRKYNKLAKHFKLLQIIHERCAKRSVERCFSCGKFIKRISGSALRQCKFCKEKLQNKCVSRYPSKGLLESDSSLPSVNLNKQKQKKTNQYLENQIKLCSVHLERLPTMCILNVSDCRRSEERLHSTAQSLELTGKVCTTDSGPESAEKRDLFDCLCKRTFDTYFKFKRHLCEFSRGFQCDLCKKMFQRKNTLIKHMRYHTGMKKFMCTICQKTFSRLKEKKSHLRKHQKAKDHSSQNNKSMKKVESVEGSCHGLQKAIIKEEMQVASATVCKCEGTDILSPWEGETQSEDPGCLMSLSAESAVHICDNQQIYHESYPAQEIIDETSTNSNYIKKQIDSADLNKNSSSKSCLGIVQKKGTFHTSVTEQIQYYDPTSSEQVNSTASDIPDTAFKEKFVAHSVNKNIDGQNVSLQIHSTGADIVTNTSVENEVLQCYTSTPREGINENSAFKSSLNSAQKKENFPLSGDQQTHNCEHKYSELVILGSTKIPKIESEGKAAADSFDNNFGKQKVKHNILNAVQGMGLDVESGVLDCNFPKDLNVNSISQVNHNLMLEGCVKDVITESNRVSSIEILDSANGNNFVDVGVQTNMHFPCINCENCSNNQTDGAQIVHFENKEDTKSDDCSQKKTSSKSAQYEENIGGTFSPEKFRKLSCSKASKMCHSKKTTITVEVQKVFSSKECVDETVVVSNRCELSCTEEISYSEGLENKSFKRQNLVVSNKPKPCRHDSESSVHVEERKGNNNVHLISNSQIQLSKGSTETSRNHTSGEEMHVNRKQNLSEESSPLQAPSEKNGDSANMKKGSRLEERNVGLPVCEVCNRRFPDLVGLIVHKHVWGSVPCNLSRGQRNLLETSPKKETLGNTLGGLGSTIIRQSNAVSHNQNAHEFQESFDNRNSFLEKVEELPPLVKEINVSETLLSNQINKLPNLSKSEQKVWCVTDGSKKDKCRNGDEKIKNIKVSKINHLSRLTLVHPERTTNLFQNGTQSNNKTSHINGKLQSTSQNTEGSQNNSLFSGISPEININQNARIPNVKFHKVSVNSNIPRPIEYIPPPIVVLQPIILPVFGIVHRF